MKFKNLMLFKCAALSIVAAFSLGAAVSISYSNRSIIETKAELNDSYWNVDSTNRWLTYTDSSYEEIEIEQAEVDVSDLKNGYVHMMFRVRGSSADDPGGITDLGEKMMMFSETSFVQVDEDNANYGYIVGRTSDMPSVGYDTLVEIYIRRDTNLNGDLPIYEQGWNSFYDSYEFTYYSSQHGGKYYVEEASYSRWSQEFKLKYSPKQYDDYDPQEITITNGALQEDSDYGNYIEGTAEINGNAQQVRARLIDRDGYDVELKEYQYWYYENDSFYWKSDPDGGQSITDDTYFSVSSAILSEGKKPENNLFTVVYYYDGEYNLPSIELTGASYEQTADQEYTVSGNWINDSGSTTQVSIVIHGEITVNEYVPEGTWTLKDGKLSFQFTDWTTQGYVSQTNQYMVYGHGDGNFDFGYDLVGTPAGSSSARMENIGEKVISLTGGYWTPSDTTFGTVTGYPVDLDGLDETEMITVNVDVQYSGNMNQRGDGELNGSWTYDATNHALNYVDNDDSPYITETNLESVKGYGNGSYDLTYQILGKESSASTDDPHVIDTVTVRLIWGTYEADEGGDYGSIVAYPYNATGLTNDTKIQIILGIEPSGQMSVEFPAWWYSPEDKELQYWQDSTTKDDILWMEGEYLYFGENNTHNTFAATCEFSLDGVSQGRDMIRLTSAVLDTAGSSYEVSGFYGDLYVSGWTVPLTSDSITRMNVESGYNYMAVNSSLFYYDASTDQVTSIVVTNATYDNSGDYPIITVENQLVDEAGNRQDNSPFTLSGEDASYAFVEKENKYLLTGVCSITTTTIGLYSPTLTISGQDELGWRYDAESYAFCYFTEGATSPSSQLSSEPTVGYAWSEASDPDIPDTYVIIYYDALNEDREVEFTQGFILFNPVREDDGEYTILNAESWARLEQPQEDLHTESVTIRIPIDSLEVAFDNMIYDQNRGEFKTSFREYSDATIADYNATYISGEEKVEIVYDIAVSGLEDYLTRIVTLDQVEIEYTGTIYNVSGTWIGTRTDVTVALDKLEGYTPERTYTYNLTFEANDGSGQTFTDSVTGTEPTLAYMLPPCSFEREGYTFKGWAYEPDNPITFQPNTTRDIDSDTTFYAIWEENVKYTISFDANGGTGTMNNVEVDKGYNTIPGCDFTRDGYEFAGWAVGSPTGTVYAAGEEVYVDANYTLYAQWTLKTVAEYRITFRGNGATAGRMSPINCGKGETKTVPGCDFTKDGFVFVGWAVDSVDSTTIVQPGQSFEINKDYTLYATWEKRVVEWRYIDMELCWYDSANPEDWAEPTKAVYYSGATEQEDLIFVTYSIYRFEANDEMGDDVAPTFVKEVTVVLKGANYNQEDDIVNVSGTFAEVGADINVSILAENFEIGETEGRNITPAQEAEIRENIPVDQNEKVEEALVVLPDATATEIVSVIGATGSAIDEDESLTPEEKEAAYNSVKKAVEASVVVGAQQATATEEGEAINDVLPENATIDMSDTLNEFYERQMDILLGRTSEPNRSTLHRAPNNEENTIDYTIPEEDYGKMISYVDNSVENMTDAVLQLRNCSGIEMIAVVETYIQKVLVSSFREFDKEAADEEFVAQAYESIMKTMQLQVIEILEKEHQPSNNPEKEAQYNETLEAVKDYETFEQMVIEVLRQKYVSATGNEVDIDTFEGMYMDIFRAWALDMPELNPHGITLEELTNATIEVTTNKANHMTFNAKFSKGENIFLIVFGSVTALSIAGAIAIPTILKKKKEGVSK